MVTDTLYKVTAIHQNPVKYEDKMYAEDVDYYLHGKTEEDVLQKMLRLGITMIRGVWLCQPR